MTATRLTPKTPYKSGQNELRIEKDSIMLNPGVVALADADGRGLYSRKETLADGSEADIALLVRRGIYEASPPDPG
jgi:hypothetical protein